MEEKLKEAIDEGGLKAHQIVFPSTCQPRLDDTRLPAVSFQNPDFSDLVLCRRALEAVHATDCPATKIPMSPMRNADVQGVRLKEAHRRTGWYLAIIFLPSILKLEEYTMPHVQGGTISGHRLAKDSNTLIVALMRGGEPMAFGVSDGLPKAMFLHAKHATDITKSHVKGPTILVDSVVNNGTTILEFTQHIRTLHQTTPIVVITGVAQSQCLEKGAELRKTLSRLGNVNIVALRLSERRFTGKKASDTGNRLFNTVHMEKGSLSHVVELVRRNVGRFM
ncbi:uracil phosphoribosyltransferase-domain-containing protein [Calycina marina]|uniref:Uracil phosphoribosyltransferase-domain-containing protein n=1 Tax=Calycina marina TaxID=1763456 RepID=A0A9P8CI87_9HELO|nr:uracil phosphoribosyltransferase-domain-containing protein [Calycina marina]